MTYSTAIKELERLTISLKQEKLDIEEMVLLHRRAKELYHFCMEKLNIAEEELKSF